MPEGERQAYWLFLPLHGGMQRGLCQCGVGPVLIAGDSEVAGGLILSNSLVDCPSRHVQHISNLHKSQSSLKRVGRGGGSGRDVLYFTRGGEQGGGQGGEARRGAGGGGGGWERCSVDMYSTTPPRKLVKWGGGGGWTYTAHARLAQGVNQAHLPGQSGSRAGAIDSRQAGLYIQHLFASR